MLVALWLLACSATDAPVPCRDEFERAADGHCYPPLPEEPEGVDVEDALASLPPCVPQNPNGAIEIEPGCASGACAGATEAEISAALNRTPTCSPSSSSDRVYCVWETSIEGLFDDVDLDGWPDPEAPNVRIHVYPGYPGGTVDGIGVGASPSCFVDVLGPPDWLAFRDVGGNLFIQDMIWDDYGLHAYDWGSDDFSGLPNGEIDNIYLYGAP